MKRKPYRLDVVAMTSATDRAVSYMEAGLKTARRLQDDPERETRIAANQCRWCHYAAGRIGGAAMTTQPCSGCAKDQLFGSTCVDVLCSNCAKEHSLCKRCGGDREMRTLRRKWPSFQLSSPPVDEPDFAPDPWPTIVTK